MEKKCQCIFCKKILITDRQKIMHIELTGHTCYQYEDKRFPWRDIEGNIIS